MRPGPTAGSAGSATTASTSAACTTTSSAGPATSSSSRWPMSPTRPGSTTAVLQIQSARDVIWERVVEYFLIVDLVDRQIFASPAVWQRWPIEPSSRPPSRRHDREGAGQSPPLVRRVGGRVLALRRARRARDRRGVHHGRGAAPPERDPDVRGSSRYFDTQLVPWRVEDEIRGVVIISHDQTSIHALPGPADHGREGHGAAARGPPGVGLGDRRQRPSRSGRCSPIGAPRPCRPGGSRRPSPDYLETLDEDSRIRMRGLLAELGPDRRASLRVSSADHERHRPDQPPPRPAEHPRQSTPSPHRRHRRHPRGRARPRPRAASTTRPT